MSRSTVGVAYFSASRASQRMCLEPRVSRETDLGYAAECTNAKDVLDIFKDGKTLQNLTEGEKLFLDRIPGWRNYLPPHLFN